MSQRSRNVRKTFCEGVYVAETTSVLVGDVSSNLHVVYFETISMHIINNNYNYEKTCNLAFVLD